MAPVPSFTASLFERWMETLKSRDLGELPVYVAPPYSEHQTFVLQVLALLFSSISVISAMLSFYWFRKMRRSFRHDLIMLLIQSDMFKSLGFMIYPIVVFVRGPVDSASAFCKINGFFLAAGIEASDFAVLLIAIHSALYIFYANPRSAMGEGGLYPYRRIAFTLWILFPLLMASLAFINNQNPYSSNGTYCYLPVRPFWYRLALSWIPRYLIFVVIGLIYVSIYFYVQYKFRGFVRQSVSGPGAALRNSRNPNVAETAMRCSLPQTPALAYNGLLPDTRHNSAPEAGSRKPSDSSAESCLTATQRFEGFGEVPPHTGWRKMRFELRRSLSGVEEPPDQSPESPYRARSSTNPPQISETPFSFPSEDTSWTGFAAPAPARTGMTFVRLLSFLHRDPQHPDRTPPESPPTSHLHLVNSMGEDLIVGEMIKTRDKIRRQIRFLFIYPLVYIGLWTIPFANHVLQYQDKYVIQPPYALTVVSIVSLVSQCAVDCWLFCTREKPWRHIPGSKGGFWESFAWWRHTPDAGTQPQSRGSSGGGQGKSRMAMVTEARRAYERREVEIAAMREERNSLPSVESPKRRGSMSWWDQLDVESRFGDGTASLYEEELGPTDIPTALLPIVREDGVFDHTEATSYARSQGRRGSRAVSLSQV